MRLGSLALVALLAAPSVAAQDVDSSVFDGLRYRHIGPEGNRISAVAGLPGNPNVYYAGAASGGIFRTTDEGTYWDPIFDGQDALSIGSITVAPSNPRILFAGMWQIEIHTWGRTSGGPGSGGWKSTDGSGDVVRTQRAVHEELRAELGQVEAELEALLADDLAAFNAMLEREGPAGVTAGGR